MVVVDVDGDLAMALVSAADRFLGVRTVVVGYVLMLRVMLAMSGMFVEVTIVRGGSLLVTSCL